MYGTTSAGMPEFVRFNHKRHIKRGFECSTCHGEVEKMDVVHKAKTLRWGSAYRVTRKTLTTSSTKLSLRIV